MSLKISRNTLLTKHYIIVDSGGVQYYDNSVLGGSKRATFDQIDAILMSPDHKLSLQMGNQIYTIQIKRGNTGDKAVIDALLQEVRRSATAAA